MKKFAISISLLFIISALSIRIISAQQTDELLTNEKIVEMVKEGFSPDLIILKIQRTSSQFDVSVDALRKLRAQGVSEEILKEMLKAIPKSAPSDTTKQNAASKQNDDKQPVSGWTTEKPKESSSQTQPNQTDKKPVRLINTPKEVTVLKNTPKTYSNNQPKVEDYGSIFKSDNIIQITEDGLPVVPGGKPAATVFRIKYRWAPAIAVRSKQEDLCEGLLTVGQTLIRIEFYSGKSFQGRDCPAEKYEVKKEKFLELKDSSKENFGNYLAGNLMFSDYVYVKIAVPDDKKKDKDKIKDFLLYPLEATVVLGTQRYNVLNNSVSNCGDCAAIVCKKCEGQLSEMKRSLSKVAKFSSYKINGEKFKNGEK